MKQNKTKTSYEKNRDTIFAIFFGMIFIILSLVFLVFKASGVKLNLDNFNSKSFISGKMFNDVDTFFNDKFVLNSSFKFISDKVSAVLGQDERNGVFNAKDGYLIQGFKENKQTKNKQIKAINSFAKKYEDIQTSVLVLPGKAAIYPNKLPYLCYSEDESKYLNSVYKKLKGVKKINLKGTLDSHFDEDIYYKTSSSLTGLGLYYTYDTISDIMEFDTSDDMFSSYAVDKDFNGELAKKSSLNTKELEDMYIYFNRHKEFGSVVYFPNGKKRASLYDINALKSSNKLDVFISKDYPKIKIDSTCINRENLLLIGDENAKQFATYLATKYQKIILINSKLYKKGIKKIIDKEEITSVMILESSQNFTNDTNLIRILNK